MYIKQLLPGEYNHSEANLNKIRVYGINLKKILRELVKENNIKIAESMLKFLFSVF